MHRLIENATEGQIKAFIEDLMEEMKVDDPKEYDEITNKLFYYIYGCTPIEKVMELLNKNY